MSDGLPQLIGAVPTDADLPAEPPPLGAYLVRATGIGWCNVPDVGWVQQDWEPGCATYWCPADQVPDLPTS